MKKSKKEVLTGLNYHLLTIVMCTAIMIFLFCIVANATDEDLTNNVEQKGVENTVTAESDAEKTEANETARVTDNTDKQEVSSRADIPRVNGSWLHDSNGWYFYNSGGEKQKGFCYINNNKYCFEENDGLMRTSWQYIDNVYYYFGGINDGAAKIGWQVINGKWYYFNESGIMQTGMKRVGNGLFYFGGERDGSMKTGWEYLDNQYYYFGKANDGVMKIGWQIIDGSWYYFDGTGVMQSGLKRVGNGLFYFGGARDGAMKTGWQNLDGDWYYFNDSGAAVNGWLQLNSMWYYFNPDYKMVKDTIITIDGRKFAFDPWGGLLKGAFIFKNEIMKTDVYGAIKIGGWVNYNGNWYFQLENGEFIKNTIKTIDGSNYIFDESGAMQSGLVTFEGKSYVTSAAGAVMRNTWAKVSSYWYYAQDNMEIYKNTMAKIGNSEYGFNESGAMYLGRFTMNEKAYITDANGVAIGYDDSAESKAREVAASLNYDLYKAFYYCANMSRYYLTSNGRTSGPIMSSADYAKYGYKNRGGDCIVMASSFKYLAQACGYSATQWFGWVGSSTHSWCEIGGYIYDPNFTNATNRSGYGLTYGQKGTWKYRKSYTM